ncbi:hypothetical protein ASJ33_06550 [Dehalococcoides mccartyi]|uniref:glycosyltransferase n=1 Tax=Dehalococcoides mccartyi TaxID=61435 RepID=UPI0004E05A79|nr:hypothetical protein X792_06075 [Dehalococcoides mccartyi CG1]APH13214.1 hypothetical protein ASJ33_06550 [Dehalococcoides mccartyi]BAQ35027.1 hypothetical protein UCH007_10690 [Dehalococcoides sp. UCH007]
MDNKTKLKLCLLANASDELNLKWANSFARRGHEVHIFSFDQIKDGVEIAKEIKFHHLVFPVKYPFTYLTFFQAQLSLMSLKPDIIHAINMSDYGILAGLVCRIGCLKPITLTAVGPDILHDAHTAHGWAIKHVLPLSKVVTCDTDEIALDMVKLGMKEDHIFLMSRSGELDLSRLEATYLAMRKTRS